ncbi:MAG TPA: DUF1622 domain-containing protein [Candidatus Acidoferrales bacterium]|nr:DUF1622 domain-containing protein [Candidatus Acidoferrales bacterium]
MHETIQVTLLHFVQLAALAIETLAVAIILVAVLSGTTIYLAQRFSEAAYTHYKHTLGKGLLLGLEVLVAADVIRTVALEPTIQNIVGLGLLVLVRTFLSWSLIVEVEGEWPWQHARKLTASQGETDKPSGTSGATE